MKMNNNNNIADTDISKDKNKNINNITDIAKNKNKNKNKLKPINLIPEKSAPYKFYLKKQQTNKAFILVSQILILVAFLGFWELFTYLGIIDSFIFSSPSRIFGTLINLKENNLALHIFTTLNETVLGFLISTLLGTAIAIILFNFKTLRKICEPYVVVLNSLPKIALGPMIIIWFGSGTTAIVIMCILICVVLTIISMLNAFLQIENEKIILLESMGASKFAVLIKLILPASLPSFISVLKVNVGLAWVGSIMGEYLVSKAGLGYLIVYGSQVFNLNLVMTSTFILCVLASLMYLAISAFEKWISKKL